VVAPVFIGDEVTAAGFRLAGLRVRSPKEGDLQAVLEWANSSTSLIYITAEYAAALEDEQQHRLLAQLYPPVVVIQDIRSNTPVQDLAKQLRVQLGVLE
jgi:vacuolar-type H+-ATPase subunit F/Vma7